MPHTNRQRASQISIVVVVAVVVVVLEVLEMHWYSCFFKLQWQSLVPHRNLQRMLQRSSGQVSVLVLLTEVEVLNNPVGQASH